MIEFNWTEHDQDGLDGIARAVSQETMDVWVGAKILLGL